MAEHLWSDRCPCGRVHGERMPSRMKPACDACGHIHVPSDAVAQDRFAGVTGYRTTDGEIHPTREAAQKWLCEQRQVVVPATPPRCECGMTDPEMPCLDCRFVVSSPAKTEGGAS